MEVPPPPPPPLSPPLSLLLPLFRTQSGGMLQLTRRKREWKGSGGGGGDGTPCSSRCIAHGGGGQGWWGVGIELSHSSTERRGAWLVGKSQVSIKHAARVVVTVAGPCLSHRVGPPPVTRGVKRAVRCYFSIPVGRAVYPRRRNVTAFMVGIRKRSHTQKSEIKMGLFVWLLNVPATC